jgi:hypothetical protein
MRWLTEFRCRLALVSSAADSVDIRVLAFGQRPVIQKGEKRGISIEYKLEEILKLIDKCLSSLGQFGHPT